SKRAAAEQFGDVFAVGLDAALDQFAVFGDDADLTGDFSQIESDEVHSWFSFASRLIPQNVRSSMLPPVAASRFIQSFLWNCSVTKCALIFVVNRGKRCL